jgi:lactate permease
MLLALYQQHLDPMQGSFYGSAMLSTVMAALPVLVLFYLLVPRRWSAPLAGLGATLVAFPIAIFYYGMPANLSAWAFIHGIGFGLLPIGWTVFNAMLLYNITVRTGQFEIVRRSVAGLSGDARVQAILIGFAFGAFLEGAAGAGSPVAICGVILVGLGFKPMKAAVLCLIANTSPVAFGGLGTPLIVLSGVTNLPTETLSVMAGHQLPFLSLLVPAYMIKVMCTWRETLAVWPALLVAGGTFSAFQYFSATSHTWIPGLQLYPMTDIVGGILAMVATALFCSVWKPRQELRYQPPEVKPPTHTHPPTGPYAEEAESLLDEDPHPQAAGPLTSGRIAVAWMPFALMSVFLLLFGLVRQREGKRDKIDPDTREKFGPVMIGSIETNYIIPIPFLHNAVMRDPTLTPPGETAKPESAEFNFAWLTAPGTAVFVAAVLSMWLLRMNRADILWALHRTCVQMKIPIPTIAVMIGLSYLTRYAGLDATLGVAFASTGFLYPFFAALLGWLGVFLTGTDAGSNALFGSLQKITATQIHNAGVFASSGLELDQAQILISTANSTGGVMGKMIDAQSIVVATAATDQGGKEADIFKAVFWHSIFLASVVGILTLLQAYVIPLTWMVPRLPKI